jgi:DNA-binding NarL/FixJ family response regulator
VVADIQGKYRMNLLIVDDSPQVREHLVSLVSHLHNVQVVGEAGSADEAVDAIRSLQPDVVILDLFIQGGGLETLQKIKMISPDSVVVMLVYYPHSRYRDEYLQAGADYVLDKLTEVKRVSQVLEALV